MIECGRAKVESETSPQEIKVLVMCEEGLDFIIRRELLRLPGSTIEVCHTYLEFMLYLAHETFQFVMIFEGNKGLCDTKAAQIAAGSGGTPVLVIKQFGTTARLNGAFGRPN